jgi:hypothetical protein
MFTNILSALAKSFSESGSHRTSSARSRRTNRRYTFNEGIEGLEGRLALSGGVAAITVTVTNQTDTSTTTGTGDQGDGSNQGDGSGQGDLTTVTVVSSQQQTVF